MRTTDRPLQRTRAAIFDAMRTSDRKHNYVSEERLAERPPGVVARRAAACMVRHHCKAFWLCLVLMAAATCGVILPGGFPGRFKFRSSYSFEMYIAGDPLTDHGDAIYQIERRPQDMLAHLRGERVQPRDHVVAKEEENFGRPWRQRRRLSEATPPPPPPETCAPICCEAMTASCLACKECKTVDEWCAANPSTEWPGCESAVEAPTAGPAMEEPATTTAPPAVVGDELDAGAAGLTAEAPVDGGAIAGVVIGVLAVVLIAVGAGVVVVWRRRQRQELPSTIVSVDPIEAKKLSV